MKVFPFYIVLFTFANVSLANIMRPFQTARLHSSAGAGIASILLPESALLNPASLGYFNESHVSYHQNSPKFQQENEDRKTDGKSWPNHSRHNGYFIFDNSSTIKGGVTHTQMRENENYRERTTVTFAKQLDGKIGLGATYRYNHDKRDQDLSPRYRVNHQAVLGLTYIHSPSLSFGAILEDAGRSIKEETFAGLGLQYSITNELVIIGDYGQNPFANKKAENNVWRAAVQFNPFSDVFLRMGRFQDGIYGLEGFGWGISWVTPKLVLDFGTKSSRSYKKEKAYLYPSERLTDTALSVALRL